MAEKVNLKIMKCPTCGASLKVANSSELITCVYCGNTIVPTVEAAEPERVEAAFGGFSGVLKVEGIKTSSSALAYMEQFFEEYDWEAFAYSESLSVAEIDSLADSLKVSSADDKNTWLVCFKAISVPFFKKISGCKQIMSSVIEEYKKDSLDAYSRFDAYKHICAIVSSSEGEVIAGLEKIAANAVKYGAAQAEAECMKADIESIRNACTLDVYDSIRNIPEIIKFNREKDAQIEGELAEKGIDAKSEYAKAAALIESKNYVEALNILLSLRGYSDANELIEKIDKYFLISDVLEIEGNLYYFKKGIDRHSFSLYPSADGKIVAQELINGISKIITNYADILYYFDGSGYIKKYNFSTRTEEKLYDKKLDKKTYKLYKRKIYMLANQSEQYSDKFDLVELDIATGAIREILKNVKELGLLTDNKLVCTTSKKSSSTALSVEIIDLESLSVVTLGDNKLSVKGFIGDYVVFTKENPNDFNQSLYVKNIASDEAEKLIEKNIYFFCKIIGTRIYYYVGNSRNKALISNYYLGTDRKKSHLNMSEFLAEQGGWLYFTRRSGYNSVLCRSRADGSRFSIIAADIDSFIDIKNGYLYYKNDMSALVRVRMDGSNLQRLCYNVEDVLLIKEDQIIFVSTDDRVKTNVYDQANSKAIKSIYAIDFADKALLKLVYNVKCAQEYDDNTVYYIAEQNIKSPVTQTMKKLDVLNKLDIETQETEELLILELYQPEVKMSKFAVALIVAFAAAFILIMGVLFGSFKAFLFGLLATAGSLAAGVYLDDEKKKKMQKVIDDVNKSNTDEKDKKVELVKAIGKELLDMIKKALKELKENVIA